MNRNKFLQIMDSVLILIICIAYTTICLSPTFNMNHSILPKKFK